jgi:phenylpyruvate tautomerase PptA (4-oxalocrotonate tautomerase family)
MPLYTAITQESSLSDETKARASKEITRIHTAIMKVPENFVRVVFLTYFDGSGYTAGKVAPTATLNCVLRSSHTEAEKTEMLKQLWSMFHDLTGVSTLQLAISLQDGSDPASRGSRIGVLRS